MILFLTLVSPLFAPSLLVEHDLTCRLEDREGTRLLFLSGTVEQRGFGEGYLLADDILACFTGFAIPHVCGEEPKLWDVLIRPGVRARFVIDDATEEWAEAIVDGMEAKRGGPIQIEELGRNLEPLDVLAWSTIPDLAGFACSSLAVWGDASASGDVLIGRNLDYSSTPMMERLSLVEVHAPMEAASGSPSKAGWVGVGWPGTFGCLTGLSEHGVFVAIHDVHMGAPLLGAKCTPRMLALSGMIETARPEEGLGQALTNELSEQAFSMGGNFMVGWQSAADAKSASRGAVVIEVGTQSSDQPSAMLRQARPGVPALACSNDHYVREGDEPSCDRYQGLISGAHSARAAEAGIDAAAMWKLVENAGMSISLYRTVADLGPRTLGVARHTPEGWMPRLELEVEDLLDAAAPKALAPSGR